MPYLGSYSCRSAAAESYPFEGFGMYPIEISSIRFLFAKSSVRKPQRPDFCSAQLNSSCEHDGEVATSMVPKYSSTKFSTSIRSRSTKVLVDLLCTLPRYVMYIATCATRPWAGGCAATIRARHEPAADGLRTVPLLINEGSF
jgi:hypothetical protein